MTLVVLATAIALLAATPVVVEPLRVVEGSGYIGAIFPASRGSEAGIPRWPGETIEGYWTPTSEEIAGIEAALGPAMNAAANDPTSVLGPRRNAQQNRDWAQRQIGSIVQNLDRYGRQYVGIRINGSKRIFISCFHLTRNGPREEPAYWRTGFVVVNDGGFWYWRIQYDVEKKRFLEFDSNGYA